MNVSIQTSSKIPGSICVTCIFTNEILVDNASCSINGLEAAAGSFSFNAMVYKEQSSDNGSLCILNLIAGIYNITVCDYCNSTGSSMSDNTFVYTNITVVDNDIGMVTW